MTSAYQQLIEYFHKLAQLGHAMTFLQWDQLVMMPPGGSQSRANALAEITAMRHELLTSTKLGDLIVEAADNPESEEIKRSVEEMRRTWQDAACLPASLVKAQSLAGSKCEHEWRQNRKDNDWKSFLNNFEEVVNLSRQEAQARHEASTRNPATPYDALLDLYCTGDSSELIDQVFSKLKSELPALITEIMAKQEETSLPVGRIYAEEDQRRLNLRLMEYLGFDFSSGRLDVSTHPFSTGDRGDQRITTRFRQGDFLEALLATAHETGHASYEAGLPEKWDNLPIGSARNMSIHESQSLLFEKQLFLAKPFFSFLTGAIHELLPQTSDLSAEQMWQSCCQVKPSLIRVEADEVTYPLHVVLRFEIEKDLINGSVRAADIPELWDEKMQKYFGLSTTGNYTDGCLQDIHWTDGTFGYFPSYTLGALNSAQLFATIRKEYGDWQERLAGGDTVFIRNWLKEKIWSKASSLDSQELLERATGESTNAEYFLAHLRERYLGDEQ